jgi:glycosyltransferase involved in cell wall biosynthesis
LIHWLPLEPLEERYTVDWARWFPAVFEDMHVPFYQIQGDVLTSSIETGSVLDAHGTNYWKMTQMARLIKAWYEGKVVDGDTLLFADLWHPGIEAVAYIRNLTGENVKIAGVLHAGTYDPSDFTTRVGMDTWGRALERSWFTIYDRVFVGSQYHKDLIAQAGLPVEKVVVTGLPFYAKELWHYQQHDTARDLIVFPHRLDPEKHPEGVARISTDLGLPVYKTKEALNHTKKAFYEALAQARVVFSLSDQETFGYAMLEAAALGCHIVVPDRLSYREIYPRECRYRDYEEAVEMIRVAYKKPTLTTSQAYDYYGLARWESAIGRMWTCLAGTD